MTIQPLELELEEVRFMHSCSNSIINGEEMVVVAGKQFYVMVILRTI